MGDQELFHKVNAIKEQIAQLQDCLPRTTQEKCACDESGHCAHHATVYNHLDDAYDHMLRAATQLQFPNGIGDRRAF